MNDSTLQTVAQTAAATAEQLAPVVLAVAAGNNPGVAAASQLAPLAISLIQTAIQLQSAGAMSQEQLAALFLSVAQGVQSSHAQWTALNATTKTA